MNWEQTPAQARAYRFVEYVTIEEIDADLDNMVRPEWPALLTRQQAAEFLGVGPKWVSDLSGGGPRGGKLHPCKVGGKVRWRLEELQAYKDGKGR